MEIAVLQYCPLVAQEGSQARIARISDGEEGQARIQDSEGGGGGRTGI